MAKETFHRTKPHVNVGTITKVFEDTSGELVLDARGSEEQGDPDAPVVLLFSAPTSSSPQSVIVAFPIDEEFQYFPLRDLPFESMEWTVDVMPRDISGAQLHVTMAVWQDKPFVATGSGELVGPGVSWLTVSDTIWSAGDFMAIDGSADRPDFDEPFQFGYAFAADYSTGGLAVEIALENMQVEITAVPEPGSLMLAGALGASLLLMRWRG